MACACQNAIRTHDKARIGITPGTSRPTHTPNSTQPVPRSPPPSSCPPPCRQFFRPFLGGIFFDRSLSTSSRLFEFVMRTLASGSNCLPAAGIGAMSQQLAGKLPQDAIVLSEWQRSLEEQDTLHCPRQCGRAWSRGGLGGGCNRFWRLGNTVLMAYGPCTRDKR